MLQILKFFDQTTEGTILHAWSPFMGSIITVSNMSLHVSYSSHSASACFSTCVYHTVTLAVVSEKELLESLPFSKQCTDAEVELLRFLYENQLKKSEIRIENAHHDIILFFIFILSGSPKYFDNTLLSQSNVTPSS